MSGGQASNNEPSMGKLNFPDVVEVPVKEGVDSGGPGQPAQGAVDGQYLVGHVAGNDEPEDRPGAEGVNHQEEEQTPEKPVIEGMAGASARCGFCELLSRLTHEGLVPDGAGKGESEMRCGVGSAMNSDCRELGIELEQAKAAKQERSLVLQV